MGSYAFPAATNISLTHVAGVEQAASANAHSGAIKLVESFVDDSGYVHMWMGS